MPRPPAPCGTPAAYKRHLRHSEPPCGPCTEANSAVQREKRAAKKPVFGVSVPDAQSEVSSDEGRDDMSLILDTLRTAFTSVAEQDPTKLAPIAREFRAAVESVSRGAEEPKELSLADQLAEVRAARAARAAGQGTSG